MRKRVDMCGDPCEDRRTLHSRLYTPVLPLVSRESVSDRSGREREGFPTPEWCTGGRIFPCEFLVFRLVVIVVDQSISLKIRVAG